MRTEPLDRSDAEATIETNLPGPISLIGTLASISARRRTRRSSTSPLGLPFVPLVTARTYCATKAALHSYTVSLRAALAGCVEVIELVPPAVQTSLTPGPESRDGYQLLDAFADEVMALLGAQPTPPEILVERVRPLRQAEADGCFDPRPAAVNAMVAAARQGR